MAPTNSRSQGHSNAPSLPDPLRHQQRVNNGKSTAPTRLLTAKHASYAPNRENWLAKLDWLQPFEAELALLPIGWGSEPKRIQRKRTKGWRMPEGAVYVGRPTDFGNPHPLIGSTPEIATKLFEEHLLSEPGLLELAIKKLRGKDLACFCPLNQGCHADVLLHYVNEGGKK